MIPCSRFLTGVIGNGIRLMSQQSRSFQILSFAEVRKEIQGGKILLLDVREKGELTTDGKIPTGKNIPLGEVAKALVLDEDSFNEHYGFSKPSNDQNIVIHCKAGVRAETAAKAMTQLGYKNIKIYPGINDWKENGGELK